MGDWGGRGSRKDAEWDGDRGKCRGGGGIESVKVQSEEGAGLDVWRQQSMQNNKTSHQPPLTQVYSVCASYTLIPQIPLQQSMTI